ncbi:hypothetical protein E2562_021120 [Oryza meyeriana var. granulata]|uniref:DUF4283 domain-containing protein n=1 Tax=Oryza meyeriana var. granulata TaxID=110450 RepID=A0A6G1BMR5_9ORYZ|nr:hypothetical protein E2562_021120 [Oryza meyeriana var. granulata]
MGTALRYEGGLPEEIARGSCSREDCGGGRVLLAGTGASGISGREPTAWLRPWLSESSEEEEVTSGWILAGGGETQTSAKSTPVDQAQVQEEVTQKNARPAAPREFASPLGMITLNVGGILTEKQLEEGFSQQFKWNWTWKAKMQANGTFQMRFPSKLKLDELADFYEF